MYVPKNTMIVKSTSLNKFFIKRSAGLENIFSGNLHLSHETLHQSVNKMIKCVVDIYVCRKRGKKTPSLYTQKWGGGKEITKMCHCLILAIHLFWLLSGPSFCLQRNIGLARNKNAIFQSTCANFTFHQEKLMVILWEDEKNVRQGMAAFSSPILPNYSLLAYLKKLTSNGRASSLPKTFVTGRKCKQLLITNIIRVDSSTITLDIIKGVEYLTPPSFFLLQ